MPPFVWMLVGLLFTSLVIVPANPAGAQAPPTDLRSFITAAHAHGLPYAEAHAYGPAAVPELAVAGIPRHIEIDGVGLVREAAVDQPVHGCQDCGYLLRNQRPHIRPPHGESVNAL